jgi:UrcA family protein
VKRRINKLILALVAITSIAAADVPQQTIQFSDLNLSHPAGIETLYQRLKSASERVCGDPEGNERNLKRFFDIRTCKAEAMQRAIAQVNNPALTQYYQRKHKAPIKVAAR